jgi:glucose uptake protein GlcU
MITWMQEKPLMLAWAAIMGNGSILAVLTLSDWNIIVKILIGVATLIFTCIQALIALDKYLERRRNNANGRIQHSHAYQEMEKK